MHNIVKFMVVNEHVEGKKKHNNPFVFNQKQNGNKRILFFTNHENWLKT